MKFDTTFEVLEKKRVEDGMGGWIEDEVVVGTIKAVTTPVKAEIMLKEHGIVSTTAVKIYTKDYIPNEFVQLQLGNKRYKILQYADFKKVRMILVEGI